MLPILIRALLPAVARQRNLHAQLSASAQCMDDGGSV